MWQLQTAICFCSRILWVRNSDSNRGRAWLDGWHLVWEDWTGWRWFSGWGWSLPEASSLRQLLVDAGPWLGPRLGLSTRTPTWGLSRCLGLILGGWAQDRWASKSEYSWKPAAHCPPAPDLTWRPYSGHCFQMLVDLPQTLSNPGTLSERRARETAAVFFKNHLI